MDVGALRARKVDLQLLSPAGLRLARSAPGMTAGEWRWWPLTDLPVLVGAVAAAVALPAEGSFDAAVAAALIALFVLAYQVKVRIGVGWATAVQPVFVAMLVLQPARVVPLLVIVAALIAWLIDVAARPATSPRLPRVVGNQWFALPPAVIIACAPQPIPWYWWVAAFVAGFAADAVMGRIRDLTAGDPIARWRVRLAPAVFDAIVTLPVLVTCLQARGAAAAWVVPASLVAMSALLAREHDGRVQSEELAGHDPLTGLANKRSFDQLLAAAAARATRSGKDGAVMIVDLDGFKGVNDTHGHSAGDEVLREVARRLRSIVREGDEVARVGGDEFALLLADAYGAERLADALAAAFAQPIIVANRPCAIGVSAGWARFGPDRRPTEAVEEADRRMYVRKRFNSARG